MPAELVLYALATFGVALIGGLVGLVLGNLRLPLTLMFADSAAAGAGTNIAVSAVAATTASVEHARAGRVDWRLTAWIVPPSIIAGFAGGYLSGLLDERVLLTVIAAVLLYSAVEVVKPPRPGRRTLTTIEQTRRAVIASTVIGVLGGVVGLILGALRLPALIRIVGQSARRAIGTNQITGAALGYAGLAGHAMSAGVDPALVVAGAIGAAPGGIAGARLSGRLSEPHLRIGIAIALVVSSLAIIGRLTLGG